MVADRLKWLHANRELVGGLKFVEEPKVLRFFLGRLAPTSAGRQSWSRNPPRFRREPVAVCREGLPAP